MFFDAYGATIYDFKMCTSTVPACCVPYNKVVFGALLLVILFCAMKNRPLREVAKFAAGLIAADFFWLVWFSQQPLRAAQFFGTTVTQGIVLPAMIFDIAVFLMLVHYAWNIGRIPAPRERSYMLVAGALFTVVAVVHLWRLFSGAAVIIDGWSAPYWLSWIGVAITTYLAYASFHLASRVRN
jgi:energy-converting hydrogenase Eha subunit H